MRTTQAGQLRGAPTQRGKHVLAFPLRAGGGPLRPPEGLWDRPSHRPQPPWWPRGDLAHPGHAPRDRPRIGDAASFSSDLVREACRGR